MFIEKDIPPTVEAFFPSVLDGNQALRDNESRTGFETRVDGRRINLINVQDALQKIRAALVKGSGFTLFTLNLDHLDKLRYDKVFARLYNNATFVTADGWPVAFLARRKDAMVRRTTGADLVLPLCSLAAEMNVPVYLFGSTSDVLSSAAAKIEAQCPGVRIVGREAPPFGFDPQSNAARESSARIQASGAKLCFIALGAPKQELFADLAQGFCPGIGFLSVGASLDYLAGTQWRAPTFLQRIGLEWAWRLALSPRRLGQRYIRCALLFAELLFMKMTRLG